MRLFTEIASDTSKTMLSVLADKQSSESLYRDAMYALGKDLAAKMAEQLKPSAPIDVCVACTVEDADFLATGIVDGFRDAGLADDHLKVACFWNKRVKRFDNSDDDTFDVAPIVKEYREPMDVRRSIVVVVKSIISGACVVKTNLSSLIEDIEPERVFVAAPVMYKGSKERLASEFAQSVADRFEFFTFAIDDQKSGEIVEPGIGGSVYSRLGLEERDAYVPQLVKVRREALTA
ncbi:hypothetical protein WM04_06945 [Burkholderia ubonensis]|uniref:hypothetical protein n=1 Tax=Burkholderia ubonensis TaxID=101571 RepID=UPI000751DB35|nr:hypothetical protein [Burkholderia ubonensis]KWI36367.1 hypothetical protein WM04_06945 [Burkholderia ubonensis]OJB15541.1 hypothetical protein BGV53_20165 [Burkholderia ubonensis]